MEYHVLSGCLVGARDIVPLQSHISIRKGQTAMVNPAATTFDGPLVALREKEIELINDIATSLTEGAEEDRRRLRDVAQDLRDMFFMVAVIGEFNAGKSSFVNALIGETLLPIGIIPT